jgi:MFS family permease
MLNWIIINHSWHWAFGALGIVGLVWVALWLVFGREGPLEPKPAPGLVAEREPYRTLLLSPTFIGCCIATFGAYWALSLGLTWFTPFIIKGLGFTQQEAGWVSVLPWIFGASVSIGAGIISQRMLRAGYTTRAARGILGAAPLVVGGFLLALVPYIQNPAVQLTLLIASGGLCGAIYVVCPAMLGEFTPVSQRGAVISIYGAVYTLAGMIAPYVMGNVIDRAATPIEGYMNGYRILAVVLITAGVAGLALLWPNTERARFARPVIAVKQASLLPGERM